MEPSRSKRQRLMMSSSYSYVSPPRLDLPATFESLNNDTLTTVLEFVGKKSYRSFGGVNKQCKEVYLNTPGMTKETFLFGYGPLSVIKEEAEVRSRRDLENEEYLEVLKPVGIGVVYHNRNDVLDWAIQEKNEYVLGGICEEAGREGRIDILNEVWSNVEGWDDTYDKEDILYNVGDHASYQGKLEVLKWLDIKGLCMSMDRKEMCAAIAAIYGQLHILKWFREVKGLKLDAMLYQDAAYNGKLHVLKWLREQEVPWGHWIFNYAVIGVKVNLDILQWLHNEGCPWNPNFKVAETQLKPEVLNWLRVNGYGDRIRS